MSNPIDIEADSYEEAREKIKQLISDGYYLLSEQIVSDNTIWTIRAKGNTPEEALEAAQRKIPNDGVLVEKIVLSTSENQDKEILIKEDAPNKIVAMDGIRNNKQIINVSNKQVVAEIKYKTKVNIHIELDRSDEKGIDNFIKKATCGSSDCIIPISSFWHLYNSLTAALIRKGLGNDEIVTLRANRIIGVCPVCHIWSSGKGLSNIAMFLELGMRNRLGGATDGEGADRLLAGICRSVSCSCRDIIIFWKPDEDRNAILRLAGMGIEVIPRG